MNNPILTSATRVVLIALVVALILINFWGAAFFENEKFSLVFSLFRDVILLVCGAFFMKSTTENKVIPTPTLDEELKSQLQ